MTDPQHQDAAVPPSADGDVLRVEHIAKKYGAVTALVDVNMHLRRGEVLGLIGDNGAGKSTLIKILCGFQPPTTGRILLDGQEVTLKSVDHARSLGIDAVYQDLALVNQLSVYHNMFLNREKVRWPLLSNRTMRKLARQYLDDMGVRIPSVDAEVAKLSGGQRQAIAVARSVYSDAKILLLDEPLAAMGVKEGAIILDLVTAQAAGRRLGHHHRAQLRPGAGGLRPGEPAPARPDHPGQAQRGDLGPGADRPRGRRIPQGPARNASEPRASSPHSSGTPSGSGSARGATSRPRPGRPVIARWARGRSGRGLGALWGTCRCLARAGGRRGAAGSARRP